MLGLNPEQVALLLILIGAFVLLLTERIRIDLTAILIIISLAITGLLSPAEALSGFSSEPAIIAVTIFVLSGAMYYTGLSDRLGLWIGRLAGRRYNRMVAVIMMAVSGLSAFTHHLTITALMIPVTLKLSHEYKVPASRLLMPMSFAASLGTTITILGAPAFLIADRILRQAGQPGLGVFSIAPIGLALSVVGACYILIAGRLILPVRKGNGKDSRENLFKLNGYYTELVISSGSAFVGSTIKDLEDEINSRFQITGWLRSGHPLSRPYDRKQLQAEDVLLVRTTPDELATIQEEPGIQLRPIIEYENGWASAPTFSQEAKQLVQAVVAPRSDLVGRSIRKVKFLERYGLVVVGIWRRNGRLRTEISRVRLRDGDVLLLLGEDDAVKRLQLDHSFLMMIPFTGEPFMRHKAPLAAFIMVVSILLAAFSILPVEIGLLAGAAAMVIFRCLTPAQAYHSIDTRIYVFIAGAIPLGLAMQQTGTADLLAGGLQSFLAGWPPAFILFLLFWVVAVVTQLMSDAGTVAILGPVAISLALGLNHSPHAYIVVVAVAAVASFLTPIGHHGNLLIYGPGGYKFSDFIKVGTPLTFLVAVITIFLVTLIWPD